MEASTRRLKETVTLRQAEKLIQSGAEQSLPASLAPGMGKSEMVYELRPTRASPAAQLLEHKLP